MSLQERVRYFEYMRPRYSNPSFASSNVGASLGLTFLPVNTSSKPIIKNYSQVPEPQSMNKPASPQEEPQTQPKTTKAGQNNGRRSKSHLSSYGTSSLGTLPKFINQRDIYEKQQKKYNIITILPKEYNETIKKYPKYRLENLDQNYYKKLKLEQEYSAKNPHMQSSIPPLTNPEIDRNYRTNEAPIRQNYDGERQEKGFRPKMLNNIDELGGVL